MTSSASFPRYFLILTQTFAVMQKFIKDERSSDEENWIFHKFYQKLVGRCIELLSKIYVNVQGGTSDEIIFYKVIWLQFTLNLWKGAFVNYVTKKSQFILKNRRIDKSTNFSTDPKRDVIFKWNFLHDKDSNQSS